MKKKVIYLTQEGFNGMKEELESLRKKLMYDIAERIKEARNWAISAKTANTMRPRRAGKNRQQNKTAGRDSQQCRDH